MPANKHPSDVPTFRPSAGQMEGSFEAFIESIEKKFAGPGICKIIPPKGWSPRKKGYKRTLKIDFQPIRQICTGGRGAFRMLLVQGKPQSLSRDFRPTALAKENLAPKTDSTEELERHYWRSLTLRPPQYGADVAGSLFDRGLKDKLTEMGSVQGWNLRRLDSLLSRTLRKHKLSLPGCSTPYLYFGMWRSTFAWHTEDVDLASVNYLHYGAPKSWYCIPPAHRERFERLLQGILPELFRDCHEFLRHKEILVSPELLRIHSIPVVKVVQRPGEFIINYPGAYHSGFNHGYNCAESTNFATRAWIEAGARARPCSCNSDSVKIQMSLFLDAASPAGRQAILDNQCDSSDSDADNEVALQDQSCSSGSNAGGQSGNVQSGPSKVGGSGRGRVSKRGRAAQAQEECATSSAASMGSSRALAGAEQTQGKRQCLDNSLGKEAVQAAQRRKEAAMEGRASRAQARASSTDAKLQPASQGSRAQHAGRQQQPRKPRPAANPAANQNAGWTQPGRRSRSDKNFSASPSKPEAAEKAQSAGLQTQGVQKPISRPRNGRQRQKTSGLGQSTRKGVLAHLSSIFMALRSQSRSMRQFRCQKKQP